MNENLKKQKIEEIYKKYRVRISGYLAKKIKDFHIVEDLVQVTFTRFMKSPFNSWDDDEKCYRYIITIAKNCWKTHVRFMSNPARNFFLSEDLALIPEASFKVYNQDDSIEGIVSFSNQKSCHNSLEILANQSITNDIQMSVDYREHTKNILAAINAMPPKRKQAMLLVCVRGVKMKDAAVILNTTTNCIGFLISTARKQLRKKLKNVQNLLYK
jgi:RNA polymerase sigma factor (sigma-70 family)